MAKRRVVITGVGVLSPLGNDAESTWQAIKESKSGIASIEHFDTSNHPTKIAGCIKNFAVEAYLSVKEARKMDKFIQYGIAAGVQAVEDAGLEFTDALGDRTGVMMGAGMGGIQNVETNHQVMLDRGPRKVSPFVIPGTIINMISGHLSIRFGLRGPNVAIATACTTGTHSIGYAARHVMFGDADIMIAGGAEFGSSPLGMAGFSAARAMSTRNDEPQQASRPWDKDRDGFVLSDGAGALILEELEHAKARGAKIYGELTGFGLSADAYHVTAPPEDGSGAATSMRNALRDAALNPNDIDYINAHGTSTPVGDLAETNAIKSVFGAHAQDLMVSSTKSMTGHLLGAAGALEAIICLQAMRDNVAPATINLDSPSEGCDLDYVPHTARDTSLNAIISNSFGFGGTNGTLVFQRYKG